MTPGEKLIAAIGRDDVAEARALLEAHAELRSQINAPRSHFGSPVLLGVRSREALDLLLEHGADLNARSDWWAGSFGLLDSAPPAVAAHAISLGARVDAHAAARLELAEKLGALLDADPSLVHARGGDGQTPLHCAATPEIAALLLERGAEIDARDIDHESTPAQWMLKERPGVARFLVERGCASDLLMACALGDLALTQRHLASNPESLRMTVTEEFFPKRNPKSGGTICTWTLGANKGPLQIAKDFGHESVFACLWDRSPPESQLAFACEAGDEATVRELRATHPGLTRALGRAEQRRLPDAAQDGNRNGVRLMLDAGWPVDATGRHGATALHWACFHGDAETASLLLSKSPPLERRDVDFHSTPLGWAIHGSTDGWHAKTGNYAAVVKALLRVGVERPAASAGSPEVRDVLESAGGGAGA